MFAADAEFHAGARGAALFGRDADEFAHALGVDGDEGVGIDDALLAIGLQEGLGVVAGDAEGGLGQVVGAEGEEFGGLGDGTGLDGAAP